MTTVPAAIVDFYQAVCAGDVVGAKAAVSEEFGVQDGKGRRDWILHELAEFAHRCSAVGFDRVILESEASPGMPGTIPFAVMTDSGQLLFEEALRLDDGGRIVGNGRMFEIVTKLLFCEGEATRRALAIRAPGAEIVAAIPTIPGAQCLRLSPGMNYENDRFTTVSFVISGDDLHGVQGSVFVKEFGSPGLKQEAYLRGVDSPRFTNVGKPAFRDRFVDLTTLAGGLPLWAVTAELEDGSFTCIEHPPFDILKMPSRVNRAVITDALDNDWSWTAVA